MVKWPARQDRRNNPMSSKLRSFGSLALAALLVWAAGGCRSAKEKSSDEKSPQASAAARNPVVLEVGNSSYFQADFDHYLRNTLGRMDEPLSASVLSRLFDRFCEDRIILEQARQQQIAVSDDEMKQYLAKVQGPPQPKRTAGPGDSSWKSLHDKLVMDKYTFLLVKDIAVGDPELKAYYDGHKSEFLQPERFEVYQILVDSEQKAVEILNGIRGLTVEDFQSAARRFSNGPEAGQGGRMGIFSPGQLPFEIERVVLALPEGQISQVMESSYGFHLFWLNKRFEAEIVPLDKAAPGIRLKLLDEKIRMAVADHLAELKNRLDWQAHTQNLAFVYQRNIP